MCDLDLTTWRIAYRYRCLKSSSNLPRDLLAVIEAKKTHKAGERLSCSAILTVGELHGCGLAALPCEIKMYKNLFCGRFGQIYENFGYTVIDSVGRQQLVAIGHDNCMVLLPWALSEL